MERNYIYDIRTSEDALRTLVNFTGVTQPIWEKYISFCRYYQYDDDLIEDVIEKHGQMPPSYEEWLFTFFHVTTSANKCKSFERHGILDLKKAYEFQDSELREFLKREDIVIDIGNCILKYGDYEYSILYEDIPSTSYSEDDACRNIGRKFYYDFTICGFLSIWDKSPYGGNVHCWPEILVDIDNFLKLNLSREWHLSHEAYEIVAQIPGIDIVYDGDDNKSEKEKIIEYLTKAYNTAFGAPFEEIILLKNNVQVPPERIIEITPFRYWNQ